MLIFNGKYGFSNNGEKFICHIYKDTSTNRLFSIVNKTNSTILYINEVDECFKPSDNTYSTLTANDLNEAKSIIRGILSE